MGSLKLSQEFQNNVGAERNTNVYNGAQNPYSNYKAPNILATTNRKVPFAVFQAGITRLCAFFAPACVRSLVCSCKFCSLAWRTQFLAWLRTSAGRASAWSQKIDGGMGHGWSQSSGTLEHERSRCARAVILVYCGGEDDKCTKKHEPAQL